MYYGLFGRGCYPRSRTCNCSPRPSGQQGAMVRPPALPNTNHCLSSGMKLQGGNNIKIKSAVFGGLIIPEGTEKRATFHVASLTLNASCNKEILVQLSFSCNIIAAKSKVCLRFQIVKQEKCQPFSIPLSTGVLYCRDKTEMEANTFTLSVCDCDFMAGKGCTYSVYVENEGAETVGTGIIASPVLIATIIDRN